MLDAAALLTLQTWFSPSLPTGAFTHSHGLEAAIDSGDVVDARAAGRWIARAVRSGGLGNDAILCAQAWRLVRGEARGGADADGAADTRRDDAGEAGEAGTAGALDELDDLARALAGGRERLIETLDQGAAFAAAVRPEGAAGDVPRSLPVAIGVAAARAGLPLEPTLAAALQGASSNLVWIGARLVPYGQREALGTVASLRADVLATVRRAVDGGLDALGNDALGGDLASLVHETQRSRVCRT